VLGQLGQDQEAADLFRQTLQTQETTLGYEDPLTRATRHNFTNLLILNGRLQGAEPLLSRQFAGIESDGFSHPTTLRAYHLLALYLEKSGDKESAEMLYRDVLIEREAVLGRFHPDTLGTRNNLAVTVGDRGRPTEALGLLSIVLDDEEDRSHPIYLRLRHNLGHFLNLSGDAQEGRMVLQCVEQDRIRTLGPNHPATLRTRWTFGESLQLLGREEEALAVYQEVVQRSKKHLGPEHSDSRLYQSVYHRMIESPIKI
jgi:tetratricopeptide (TPR) repeat protein